MFGQETMSRVFTSLRIGLAGCIVACWFWFQWVMTELSLDYPTRLAGVALGYPPPGALAYYWGCGWAVFSTFVALFFPYTIAAIAAAYALVEATGRSVTSCAVTRWIGLGIAAVCALPVISGLFVDHADGAHLLMHSGWPAVVVLAYRPLWRHSLIVLSSWAGCVIAAMGVDHAPAFVAAGLALTALNCHAIYRHEITLHGN